MDSLEWPTRLIDLWGISLLYKIMFCIMSFMILYIIEIKRLDFPARV